MPTDTFKKLSEEKKNKIITAAKKEFARVPLAEASIKNIVDEAQIARGSFYQYFESKEDLLTYILETHITFINHNIKKVLEESKGDIFALYIDMYEKTIKKCGKREDIDFYKKIFENVKACDDGLFTSKIKAMKPKEISEYFKLVNSSTLKIKNEEELKIVSDMLFAITRRAIISTFKLQNKEKSKEDFLKQLEYIKYGIMK